MKTVVLGKTGLEVSRIGMGGIPIQRPPLREAITVIQHTLNLGINFIDTALAYGDSENRFGKAIAGRREEVIIATKGGWGDKKTTAKHITWSLQRLNTDYIDLWQFHGVSTLEGYEKVTSGSVLKAAQDALHAGKIRHLGLTGHNIDVALRAVSSGLFETIQFPFNFISHEAADELVSLAREYDVGFIGMKPFAGGNITDAHLAIKYVLQFDTVVPDPGIEKIEEIEEL
jgi:aryl-alcohol dehydrogenase-like predicted oxidoreductase